MISFCLFNQLTKRNLLLIIIIFCSTAARAQNAWRIPFPVDTSTHEVSYQGTIEVPAATAAALYARAKAWHAAAAEAATRLPLKEDEVAGLFIGKSTLMVGDKRFVYTLAVECRAGQYEYLLTQFQLLNGATSTPSGVPGRTLVTFPTITPLLAVATAPANLTSAGETRPAVQKMLIKANAAFEQLVGNLQQAMAASKKG